MRGRTLFASAAGVLGAVAVGAWLMGGGGTRPQGPGTAEIDLTEGRALYAEFCASCHGANLEGQPDWRRPGPDGRLPAPPHDATGHTWHHPDSVLFQYTKLGGQVLLAQQEVDYDSGMPAFGDRLSDRQILNIIEFIKSTWPERERALQAQRSAADPQQGEQ